MAIWMVILFLYNLLYKYNICINEGYTEVMEYRPTNIVMGWSHSGENWGYYMLGKRWRFTTVLVLILVYLMTAMGQTVIGISGSLIWSKTLMELIFNPCGEFRWSPEGPVNQIHSPHLHVGVPGIFSDLLRSVEMIKREWGAESNGKLLHLLIPSKTAALISEFAVEDLPATELQSRFLRLQWRICPWVKHSDDDDIGL